MKRQQLDADRKKKYSTKSWVIHKFVHNGVDKLLKNPQLVEAATAIKQGEVIAFPTETVYGLGANALSNKAVHKIFEAKGRPSDNPLIVHIADVESLDRIVDNIPGYAQLLMKAFWPGPLTLIFPKKEVVSSTVSAGLQTVAVRMPNHPIALALIKAAGVPVAAPSANRSGKPSPTAAEHVKHDLDGRIAGIIDGGETGVGLESTVVDTTGERPIILRPGGITKEQLEAIVGAVDVDPALQNESDAHTKYTPKSPGVKYKHYAPEALMFLVSEAKGIQEMIRHVQSEVDMKRTEGYKVAILATEETCEAYEADLVLSLGSRNDLKTVARSIYSALRQCDERNMEYIYAESFPVTGLGEAIMNRLLKAANGQVIT